MGWSGLPLCKVRRKPGFVARNKPGVSLGQTCGRPKANQTKKFMFMCLWAVPRVLQRFRKGVGGQRVWHKEIHPTPQAQAFFCTLFLSPLMSRRTQARGTIFAVFWALLVANPLPPTPFRNLWSTAEKGHREMRTMSGNALETVPFRTNFGCTKYCQTSTSNQRELWEQNRLQPHPCN